jgi:hypothetical protein
VSKSFNPGDKYGQSQRLDEQPGDCHRSRQQCFSCLNFDAQAPYTQPGCGLERSYPTYGIITTTDIRDKIIGQGRNPSEMTVRDIMTAPVYTASPEWSLKEASVKMQELNIHHMPVADAGAIFWESSR